MAGHPERVGGRRRVGLDAVLVASLVVRGSDSIRASRWLLLAYRWLPGSSRGVVLGEFVGVRLLRPNLAMAHGHTCVMRHSWCLLPQSIARCP